MDEKKLYLEFREKNNTLVTHTAVEQHFINIEKTFGKINELLEEAGVGACSYESQLSNGVKLLEDWSKLYSYVDTAPTMVYDHLDHPLFLNFSKNATEILSDIKIDDYSTENTFELQEYYSVQNNSRDFHYETRTKSCIRLEDFLTVECTPHGAVSQLKDIEYLGIFRDLYQQDFDILKQENKDLSTTDCIEFYLKAGEFDHTAYHPVKDFLSALADITIIIPLIDCVMGRDIITGERLNDFEISMKAVGAAIDIFTLGSAAVALKGTELAGKELLKCTLKTILVEGISDATATAVAYTARSMGVPDAMCIVLALATGCTVSKVGTNYLLKDVSGHVTELAAEEAEGIVRKISSGEYDINTVISEVDEIPTPLPKRDFGELGLRSAFGDMSPEEAPTRVYMLTSPEVRKAIERQGISVEDFSKLLDPKRELTAFETDLVRLVRDDLGTPKSRTVMSKVIPQSDIYKYLHGDYKDVRGCVAVDKHAGSLLTFDEVYEGLRLDYNTTMFKSTDGIEGYSIPTGKRDSYYGKITYKVKEAESIYIPEETATVDNFPYTGRGFTGSKNIVLPEYKQVPRKFETEDVLKIYDAYDGKVIMEFVYDTDAIEPWVIKK